MSNRCDEPNNNTVECVFHYQGSLNPKYASKNANVRTQASVIYLQSGTAKLGKLGIATMFCFDKVQHMQCSFSFLTQQKVFAFFYFQQRFLVTSAHGAVFGSFLVRTSVTKGYALVVV